MRRVSGVVQHYAWGDPSAIPALLGVVPDGRPWAEWWLGTHPGGPSSLSDGSLLSDVAGELPFLTKVLAAASPLSLQTHPDTATARAGFDREEGSGVLLSDPSRVYRDRFAKPELLCALTPFDALCGFAPAAASVAFLEELGVPEMASVLREQGLASLVSQLYRRVLPASPLVEACVGHPSAKARLVCELEGMYPGDPSVAVTLFLNLLHLEPFEALYLLPGTLHAYVSGVGVEVMGSSDNVIRGGLTPKHVDVDELLRVLCFDELADPVLRPVRAGADGPGVARWEYVTPSAPFRLSRLELDGVGCHRASGRELLLCSSGDAGVLVAGEAVFLAAGEVLELAGRATVWVSSER